MQTCDNPEHLSVIHEVDRGYRLRRSDCLDCARFRRAIHPLSPWRQDEKVRHAWYDQRERDLAVEARREARKIIAAEYAERLYLREWLKAMLARLAPVKNYYLVDDATGEWDERINHPAVDVVFPSPKRGETRRHWLNRIGGRLGR